MSTLLEIKDLNKNFANVEALRGINLEVEEGEIIGLLGPNGAGKTTLLKSIIGLLKPTSGQITLDKCQLPADRKKIRPMIGYMPQDFSLYEDISIYNNIYFYGKAHYIDELEEKVADVLKFTNLQDDKNRLVRNLSGGMKRRVSLACTLIHQPKILFLDEPTAGIDPELREGFWSYFRQLADNGTTIVITTHLMDEAHDCDRLALIYKGKVIKADTVTNIMELAQGYLCLQKKQSDKWEEHDFNNKKELVKLLQQNGLDSEIELVDIKYERLQEIILKLIKAGGQE